MNPNRRLTTILTALAVTFPAFAQTSRSVWDGVYTQEQANRGKTAYAEQCASCHGAELRGGDETPAVVGDRSLFCPSRGKVHSACLCEPAHRTVDRPRSKKSGLTRCSL